MIDYSTFPNSSLAQHSILFSTTQPSSDDTTYAISFHLYSLFLTVQPRCVLTSQFNLSFPLSTIVSKLANDDRHLLFDFPVQGAMASNTNSLSRQNALSPSSLYLSIWSSLILSCYQQTIPMTTAALSHLYHHIGPRHNKHR